MTGTTIIKITLLEETLDGDMVQLIKHLGDQLNVDLQVNEEKRTVLETEDLILTRKYFYVRSNDSMKMFEFCRIMDHHKEVPVKGFEVIQKYDFTISCIQSTIHEQISTYLNNKNEARNTIQLNFIEDALYTLNSNINKMTERMERMENYMQKSGLLQYRTFMTFLVDELDHEEIIDGERAKDIMFKTEH